MASDGSHDEAKSTQPIPVLHKRTIWTAGLTFWAIGVAGFACVSYRFFDRPMAQFIHDSLPKEIGDIASQVTKLGLAGIYLVALPLLYLICVVKRLERAARAIWIMFLSVLISGLILVDVTKVILGRCRPKLYFEEHLYGFKFFKRSYTYNSFPSGHSSTIAAVCVLLWIVCPRGRPLWLLLGLIIGATRVLTESHYLSDVAFGLFLGAASSICLWRWWSDRLPPGFNLMNHRGTSN